MTLASLKKALETKAGKLISGGLLILASFALYQSLFHQKDAIADMSRDRLFIDAENLRAFKKTIEIGDSIPVKSPFTGKPTGYEAELCYWTKDGKTKTEPTPVLLNLYRNITGPTFCPDCGRLVVGMNPIPRPGGHPPPTKEQYAAKRGSP